MRALSRLCSAPTLAMPYHGAEQNSFFSVPHSADEWEWEHFMVPRRVQLQRSLSETRGTNNSGTASWPAYQECLYQSRVVFVCQNTLVILRSITLNNGLLPFLGH